MGAKVGNQRVGKHAPSAVPNPRKAALPRANGGSAGLAGYKPRTALGRRLLEIRARYIASGGRLLSADELDAELTSMRERSGPQERGIRVPLW
ncbi:MAG: hypothetical protein NTW87_15020 [Planctomycetota bacterium]|nr:hypothetical protein [Planctomycetota bacterium]